jgi:ABC-type polysaccharide/polyol phosphate export permease
MGVSWLFISFSMFVMAKVFIFGILSDQSIGYFAIYLSVGYLVYRFITVIVTDGAQLYINSETWIKGEALPMSVYVYRSVLRNLIVTAYSAIPVILICFYFKSHYTAFVISLIPALAIYILNAIWISATLGLICTRHRDLNHLLTTIMSITYFLTPVLWVPPDEGRLADVAMYNPITHYIVLIREPLLENTIPTESWLIAIGLTFTGIISTWTLYSFFKHRMIYWL